MDAIAMSGWAMTAVGLTVAVVQTIPRQEASEA
jgi:hypothetical protein